MSGVPKGMAGRIEGIRTKCPRSGVGGRERVLCAYIKYCDILHYVFVIYDVYYIVLTKLGPEGPPSCRTGGSH